MIPAIADKGSHIEPWFAVVLIALGLLWLLLLLVIDEIRAAHRDQLNAEEEERRGTPAPGRHPRQ